MRLEIITLATRWSQYYFRNEMDTDNFHTFSLSTNSGVIFDSEVSEGFQN